MLDHTVTVCLASQETARLSSRAAAPFCTPTSTEHEFLSLHILTSVLDLSLSGAYVVGSYSCVICSSPATLDVEHLFSEVSVPLFC